MFDDPIAEFVERLALPSMTAPSRHKRRRHGRFIGGRSPSRIMPAGGRRTTLVQNRS